MFVFHVTDVTILCIVHVVDWYCFTHVFFKGCNCLDVVSVTLVYMFVFDIVDCLYSFLLVCHSLHSVSSSPGEAANTRGQCPVHSGAAERQGDGGGQVRTVPQTASIRDQSPEGTTERRRTSFARIKTKHDKVSRRSSSDYWLSYWLTFIDWLIDWLDWFMDRSWSLCCSTFAVFVLYWLVLFYQAGWTLPYLIVVSVYIIAVYTWCVTKFMPRCFINWFIDKLID